MSEIDISPLREMLQVDGADAELIQADEATGTARLRLVIDDVDCADCVMPRPFLESLALQVLKEAHPALKAVHIEDPRER